MIRSRTDHVLVTDRHIYYNGSRKKVKDMDEEWTMDDDLFVLEEEEDDD